jgi:hypothetical protein
LSFENSRSAKSSFATTNGFELYRPEKELPDKEQWPMGGRTPMLESAHKGTSEV